VTLDASALSSFQRCPRLYLLNQSKEIRRWRPRSLFISQFRKAIHRLSTGSGKLEDVTKEAVADLLEIAARPGIDTANPFECARSLCSILKTTIARVHASRIPSLSPLPHILLSDSVKWSCGALFDGERLHRWTAVDSLNDSTLSRELHSWYVVGDCAVSALPMTVHVIEIGRQAESGRFNSPWCRTWAHPIVIHRHAFQQKDGKPLQGKWRSVYFEDAPNDPQTWIELMDRDGVQLLKDVCVKQLSVEQAEQIKREILIEAKRMEEIDGKDWKAEPMRRTACDLPVCGWQSRCYGAKGHPAQSANNSASLNSESTARKPCSRS
jgi:hypothetical protein